MLEMSIIWLASERPAPTFVQHALEVTHLLYVAPSHFSIIPEDRRDLSAQAVQNIRIANK